MVAGADVAILAVTLQQKVGQNPGSLCSLFPILPPGTACKEMGLARQCRWRMPRCTTIGITEPPLPG